jgi:hypothetical protein
MLRSDRMSMHSLECLRLEADCRELARNVRDLDLQSHYLRMAEVWLALAVSGPNPCSGEGISEAKTQTA